MSEAIVQLNSKARIHADALEGVIQARNEGIVIFQLQGFDWTIVYEHRTVLSPDEMELPQLSNVLKTRAMFLAITDTSSYTYHQLWDNGESVEHFIFETLPLLNGFSVIRRPLAKRSP